MERGKYVPTACANMDRHMWKFVVLGEIKPYRLYPFVPLWLITYGFVWSVLTLCENAAIRFTAKKILQFSANATTADKPPSLNYLFNPYYVIIGPKHHMDKVVELSIPLKSN